MRRHRALVFIMSLGVVFVSGCGGSGGGSGGSGTTPLPQTNDFTLATQAVQLDQAPSLAVTSVTEDTVVLQNAPAISAGQVLVHNGDGASDEGFVRKVVSATVAGETTTVQTAPATIADAFTKATIDQDNEFSQDDLNRVESADDSITVSPSVEPQSRFAHRPGKSRAADGGAIDIHFDNTSIKNANGQEIATLDGTVTVSGGVTGALDIASGTLSRFQIAPFLNAYGNLHLTTKVAGAVSADVAATKPVTITTPNLFGPFSAYTTMQYRVKVDGSGPTGTEIQVSATVQGKAGFEYTLTGGLQKTTDLKKTISMTAPKTDTAEYELAASLARPVFDVKVTGLGTASTTADVLRTIATSKATTTPAAGFNSQAFGEFGATARAKVTVPILGVPQVIDTGSVTASIPRFPISDVIFYPSGGGGGNNPTSQILYIPYSGREIRSVSPDGTNDRSVVTSSSDYLGRPSASGSATSRYFAYVASSGQNPGLFTKTLNTDEAPRHLDTAGKVAFDPAYSRDGTSIAFAAQDASTRFQIFTVDLNSGVVRQITTGATDHTHPTWTPDGQAIYYEIYQSGKNGIAVSALDGTPEQIIVADGARDYTLPKISPDGTLGITVVQNVGVVAFSLTDNPNPQVIISDPTIISAAFSPDGRELVVGTESYQGTTRSAKLYIYPVTGGTGRYLIDGFAPEWTTRP